MIITNTPQEIRELIILLAKKKGISVNKMLIDSGLSKGAVDSMKIGKMPSAMKLFTIANFLDVSVDFLLTGCDQSKASLINPSNSLSENEEKLITILKQFDDADDQIEFIGRARKLARDMKLEIMSLSEEAL